MRKAHPTDLSDPEWELLERLIPPAGAGGRPRKHNMRQILNAIFYLVRAGRSWEMLPKEFPPKSTVFYYFNIWRKNGTWKLFNDFLREKVRLAAGRNAAPSAGVLDAQSVKASDCCENRGYDAEKKINGRKRHLLMETSGLVLLAIVHTGNIQDRDGAKLVLEQARAQFPTLRKIWPMVGTPESSSSGSHKPAAGSSKSSSARTRQRASRSCRGAGWWSVPSVGS
jgi:putative transposase